MSIGPFGVKSVYSIFRKNQSNSSGGGDKDEVGGTCGILKSGS